MPDILHIAVLLLAGAAAGFLAGLFGVGGGILLVPVLVFFFDSISVPREVATHLAFGTSLFVVVFASLSSAFNYWKNGHVIWRAVLILGLFSIVGAAAGTTVAADLRGQTLQQIFSAVVALTAIRMLIRTRERESAGDPNPGVAGLGAVGIIVGIVSSLAGVGGGVFSIPMMHYVLRFPLKRALGTSSATIVITGTAAAIGYMVNGWGNAMLPPHTLGYVDWLHALPLLASSLPMATLGARTAHATHVDKLKLWYALFLLAISIRMFLL